MGYIDNPITTDAEDRFDFIRYRDALVDVVASSDTPLTIGIFGSWGSGKTSLLNLVREGLLHRPREKPRWRPIPVEFSAWLYDRDCEF